MDIIKVKRALISVSNKEGVTEFASALVAQGVEILSTGGTARVLQENGVPVRSVDSYTGFPEIMDGRVKTLHPLVHGALLAVRTNSAHTAQMEANGISPIDLVAVNLYPFQKTVARSGVTWGEAIENIDIGGPTMVRSAAKNHAFVTVVVDPADYAGIADEIRTRGGTTRERRVGLAVKAFGHTAEYDTAIHSWLDSNQRHHI